jgi:hypothetical protein
MDYLREVKNIISRWQNLNNISKPITSIFFILFLFLFGSIAKTKDLPLYDSSKTTLPPCTQRYLDNCWGVRLENNYSYYGEFKNDQFHGKGTLIISRTENNKIKEEKYEGNFKSGTKDGKFKISYQDGSHDIAEYKKDLLDGKVMFYDQYNTLLAEEIFKKDKVKSRIYYPYQIYKKIEIFYNSNEEVIKETNYYEDGRIEIVVDNSNKENNQEKNQVKKQKETKPQNGTDFFGNIAKKIINR